jgi:hypothetical protein
VCVGVGRCVLSMCCWCGLVRTRSTLYSCCYAMRSLWLTCACGFVCGPLLLCCARCTCGQRCVNTIGFRFGCARQWSPRIVCRRSRAARALRTQCRWPKRVREVDTPRRPGCKPCRRYAHAPRCAVRVILVYIVACSSGSGPTTRT